MNGSFDPLAEGASGILALAGETGLDPIQSIRMGKKIMVRLTAAQTTYVENRAKAGRGEEPVPLAVVIRYLVNLGMEEDTKRLARAARAGALEREQRALQAADAAMSRGPVPVTDITQYQPEVPRETTQWEPPPPPPRQYPPLTPARPSQPDFDPTALGNPFREAR